MGRCRPRTPGARRADACCGALPPPAPLAHVVPTPACGVLPLCQYHLHGA